MCISGNLMTPATTPQQKALRGYSVLFASVQAGLGDQGAKSRLSAWRQQFQANRQSLGQPNSGATPPTVLGG